MNNFPANLIRAQVEFLWYIREAHAADLTVNQISWIDDDITYVEVKYLNDPNDSTRADEYRNESPEAVSFFNAYELLIARLHNTLFYLK